MFIAETLHAFQLDHQHVLDEDIGEVVADRLALLSYTKGSLRSGPDAAKAEFPKQGALVDLLEESGAEGIGNLKHCAEHALGQ